MRIVIKVGTSTLAHATGLLNIRRVEKLCEVMSDLKNAGHQLVLVSSGAIGMGVGKLLENNTIRDYISSIKGFTDMVKELGLNNHIWK